MKVGSLTASSLLVSENASINGNLILNNALAVGQGGLMSQGNATITGVGSINGRLGVSTTTPNASSTVDVSGKVYLKSDAVNSGELKMGYASTTPGYYAVFAP
jgi:hypothetical protein